MRCLQPDLHDCDFDWHAEGVEELRKKNPGVEISKLEPMCG